MSGPSATTFELATWYDTWNQTGLNNLLSGKVPLGYATRYNLAFGEFVSSENGYTVNMNGRYATRVMAAIRSQAPTAVLFAGIGDTGLVPTVRDNRVNGNRSTRNIVHMLLNNGFAGITIDSEGDGMSSVAELVTQLGPDFRTAGLRIVVSVPWPGRGPVQLYGENAISAFTQHVAAVELQDYSSDGTPADVPVWTNAGIRPGLLVGGVATENGRVQTSLEETRAWTQYALKHGLRGMFSWRLDNDHGQDGENEDVDPTFTGAAAIYQTVHGS